MRPPVQVDAIVERARRVHPSKAKLTGLTGTAPYCACSAS